MDKQFFYEHRHLPKALREEKWKEELERRERERVGHLIKMWSLKIYSK
jgi:hypothetical protein